MTIKICFLIALLHTTYQNPLPNKVWFKPGFIRVGTDQLEDFHVITCHHNFDECSTTTCLYKWRVENNLLEDTTPKYELVNNKESLMIKPPLNCDKFKGPIACIVEANGRPLGEAVSKIIFLDTTSTNYTEIKPTNAPTRVSLALSIGDQFKDSRNIALFIILGIMFFVFTVILLIVLHCHLSNNPMCSGYELVTSVGANVKKSLTKPKTISPIALEGVRLKPPDRSNEDSSEESDSSENSESESSESESDSEPEPEPEKKPNKPAPSKPVPSKTNISGGQNKPRSNSVRPPPSSTRTQQESERRKYSAIPSQRSHVQSSGRTHGQSGQARQAIPHSTSRRQQPSRQAQ